MPGRNSSEGNELAPYYRPSRIFGSGGAAWLKVGPHRSSPATPGAGHAGEIYGIHGIYGDIRAHGGRRKLPPSALMAPAGQYATHEENSMLPHPPGNRECSWRSSGLELRALANYGTTQ